MDTGSPRGTVTKFLGDSNSYTCHHSYRKLRRISISIMKLNHRPGSESDSKNCPMRIISAGGFPYRNLHIVLTKSYKILTISHCFEEIITSGNSL